MSPTPGTTSTTTVVVSAIVLVLLALGVWAYLHLNPEKGAPQGGSTNTATGELTGTVVAPD